MDIEIFIEEVKKLGIILKSEQLKQLDMYYNLLIEWNKKTNLTRITEKKDVYLKHFYDSLTLTKAIDLDKQYKLCDVGTGAGFPGIVLKIIFPNLDILLIDSLNKRVVFLNYVIEQLGLKRIKALHERMEIYSKNNKEVFDIITSRAVSSCEVLSEISIPALKIGGHLLLMKSSCEEEIKNANKTIKELNAKINEVEKFNLPIENSLRTIIDIKKIGKTSLKYPRQMSKIKKTL